MHTDMSGDLVSKNFRKHEMRCGVTETKYEEETEIGEKMGED